MEEERRPVGQLPLDGGDDGVRARLLEVQMIKYATAIRTRTASTEAILRRFTRNVSHPTYAAML
ncbi:MULTISPECIES: hypothetical protein [unclassified Streptomyces]|uniref:hypothetical protein n=1 Tax=unclassified Streptomyces TaxID=2593676 RepID=UPI0022510B98|nr:MULTISPECIES: hypothetical protein [unclassified Streptomyces]MCX5338307.1 hypothetical protein [Streptomyces sp. NBC_00140]MCX5367362.1 hypothetical protein [Streptomyces sp. NBC_00124]